MNEISQMKYCNKHPQEKMTLLLNNYVCDICDGKKKSNAPLLIKDLLNKIKELELELKALNHAKNALNVDKLPHYGNATRPLAWTMPYRVIFNDDDIAPNYSNGEYWTDMSGCIT